jgi:hypothetical protein
MKMSLSETVAALTDPERSEDGVWSLLAHLGIGVYTGDGTPVMPGSETQEEDFWLYDFEIGSLVQMAGQSAEPFASYHAILADLGYPGSETELLVSYHETYAEHTDHIFVQLLNEMGVDFSGNQMITPLQSWLLLLDTFVPPNGGAGAAGISPDGGGHLMLQMPPQQGVPCGQITGSGVTPYWGLMGSDSDVAAYFAAVEVHYAIHGPLIASAVEASLTSTASEVHEGHNEKGDRVEYNVNVQVNFQPQASVPVAATSCGVLQNMGLEPLTGGFVDVPVDWKIADTLQQHGDVEEMEPVTDGDGKAKAVVQLVEEEAAGIGPYKEELGEVSAYLDLRVGFQFAGITDSRLLDFVPAEKELGPSEILVSWHEACHEFTIWFTEEMHQSVAVYSNDIFIEGPITVEILVGGEQAILDGSGTLPLTGGGQAGDCRFTNSGADQVSVSGTVVPAEGDAPPMLNMTIDHAFQVSVAGNKCGGGSPVPIPGGGGAVQMPLRNGEMYGGPFSQPTVTGVTTYKLEVPCWQE